MAGDWETVIGLEIHVQLRTESKLFCSCPVSFGAPPNTLVCPVCLGLPGALPVVNDRAIQLAARAALAFGCTVHPRSAFARKNYFYPDLPKGYQISQFEMPLATGGAIGPDRVRIRRLHVEEDSGKSLHHRFPDASAIDLNRAGVPLAEIVTEPDLRSASATRTLLGRLKRTLEYIDVSDCNMEEGSLRVDANVSVRRPGSAALATKTEVKNMNSFSQLEKALEYESDRHIGILESGGDVEHQTMLWDVALCETRPMRGKEEVHDYRYFPEPDLPELQVAADLLAEIESSLPELPWQKVQRFVDDYLLPAYDAEVLSADHALADYFEAVVGAAADPKAASNWTTVELLALCNELGRPVDELGLEPRALAGLIRLVKEDTLSHNLGRQVLRKMVESGRPAEDIMETEGLRLVTDEHSIGQLVSDVVAGHPVEVDRYRAGEEKLLTFFIGQVMRKSSGKADPEVVRAMVREVLSD